MCGFDDDALLRVIEIVLERQTSQRDFAPIFVTDSLSFHLFRRYGFAFEYFPLRPVRQTVCGAYRWSEYAEDRLALLMRKYRRIQGAHLWRMSLKKQADA